MSDTKTKRVEFVVSAKDEASRVIARTRETIRKELKAIDQESRKLATSSGMTMAERQGLTSSRKGSDLGAARSAEAARIRSLRSEMRGISTDENEVRNAMNARVTAMDRAGARERARAEAERRLFGEDTVATAAARQRASDMLGGIQSEAASFGGRGGAGGGRGGKSAAELSGLKGLKAQLKPLEDVGKLLRGAGAIGAVGLITNTLADATGRAADLVKQFREGKITTDEMASGLLKSVPILGRIWEAGRNIREIFTGEQAAIEKIYAEQKRLNDAQKMQNDLRSTGLRLLKESQQRQAGMRREMFAGGLTGSDQQREEMKNATDAQVADIKARAAEQARAIRDNPETAKMIQELEDKGNKVAASALRKERTRQAQAVEAQGNAEAGTARAAGDAALQRFNQEQAKAAKETAKDQQRAAEDAEAEGEERRLRLRGKFAEASIAEIKRRAAREVEAEDEARRKILEDFQGTEDERAAVADASARKISAIKSRALGDELAAKKAEEQRRGDQAQDLKQNLRQQDLSLAARVARMGGQGRLADEINNRASLESDLESINKSARDQARERPAEIARIEAERADQERRARARFGMSELESAMERGKQYQSDSPAAIRGEMGALRGIIGSRGQVDPALAEAKKTADAVAKSLGIQKDQVKATEKLQDLFAELNRNLKALPA